MPVAPNRNKPSQSTAPAPKFNIVWVKRIIHIPGPDGKLHKVVAECLGPIAVHDWYVASKREPGDIERWVVTHIPTIFKACTVGSRTEALKVGQKLWELAGKAMTNKTKEQVVAAVPESVVDWLKLCQKVRKYVDPT